MTHEPTGPGARRHLIIAGTGRAGTTFLVRYLTALGLDTQLSRKGESAWTDEQAQAGLEDFPVGPDAGDLPYVIKNPMFHEFLDQMLGENGIALDGVIIPIRNLREATSSRVVLERRSMYESMWWMQFMDKAWDSESRVPGGLVTSLNTLDEARILSMGLHILLERLVREDIPTVLIDFPRMIHDADYLFKKISPLLPAESTLEMARSAHAALASPEKVRIEAELGASGGSANGSGVAFESDLDRIALRREVTRLSNKLKSIAASEAVSPTREYLQNELVQTRERLRNIDAAFVELREQLADAQQRHRDLSEQLVEAIAAKKDLESLVDASRRIIEQIHSELKAAAELHDLEHTTLLARDTEIAEMKSSKFWRLRDVWQRVRRPAG